MGKINVNSIHTSMHIRICLIISAYNNVINSAYFIFLGTTANVSFILTGEKAETPPRYLADDKRPVLQRSNCDGFIMATPKSLGKLTHVR